MKLASVKKFMLDIIKNDFGYDFNTDWHWDIINLKRTYLNKRSILLVETKDDEVVATIAGRPYDKLYRELSGRYTSEDTIGIWRHYVKKDLRGKGIGTKLLRRFEEKSKKLGYRKLYLHTQKTIPGSLEYWLAKGYKITVDVGDKLQTVHLEKKTI